MRISKEEKLKLPKRLDYNEDLETCISNNSHHRKEVELSTNVGCYYCCNIYSSAEIKEWWDDEETALCPHCGIDAVLPSYSVVLSTPFLRELSSYYFHTANISYQFSDGVLVDIIDVDGSYEPSEFNIYKENQLEAYRLKKEKRKAKNA